MDRQKRLTAAFLFFASISFPAQILAGIISGGGGGGDGVGISQADAYARYLVLGGEPMPLVFAGGNGWLMDDFHEHIHALGIHEKIILTGYISDTELIWLYRSCYANLYPTLFEGFGLPVLEGMQFGAATITSNTTSIPEVAVDAAWLLDPKAIEDWAQAMLILSRDNQRREAMQALSHLQAARFDWASSAQALLALYDKASQSPKRFMISSTV